MDAIKGWPAVAVMMIAAAACAVVAVLYAQGTLQFLTSKGQGHHYTHALLFGGLAVVFLVAASFLRARPAAS